MAILIEDPEEPAKLPCPSIPLCLDIDEMIASAPSGSAYRWDPAWLNWRYDVFTNRTEPDPGAEVHVAGYTRDMHRAWVSTMNPQFGRGSFSLSHPPPPFDANRTTTYQS